SPPTNGPTGPNPAFSPDSRPPISAVPAGYSRDLSRLTGPLCALIHLAMPLIQVVTLVQMAVSPFHSPWMTFLPACSSQVPAKVKLLLILPGSPPIQVITLVMPFTTRVTVFAQIVLHAAAMSRRFLA